MQATEIFATNINSATVAFQLKIYAFIKVAEVNDITESLLFSTQ